MEENSSVEYIPDEASIMSCLKEPQLMVAESGVRKVRSLKTYNTIIISIENGKKKTY